MMLLITSRRLHLYVTFYSGPTASKRADGPGLFSAGGHNSAHGLAHHNKTSLLSHGRYP